MPWGAWLGPEPDFVVLSVQVEGDHVSVGISGEGTPPSAADLADALRSELGRSIVVSLRVSPVVVTTATSPPR